MTTFQLQQEMPAQVGASGTRRTFASPFSVRHAATEGFANATFRSNKNKKHAINRKKEIKVKTNISIVKTTAITIIAAVAIFGAAGHLNAQEKGSARGGAQQLMSKPVKTLADLSVVQPGDMMVMSCPKCKNVTISYVEPTFKAMEPKNKVKTRHTCPGCNTTITVEGHGKAKKDVVKHVCQKCGSKNAFCCVMKKDGEPTKGMETK